MKQLFENTLGWDKEDVYTYKDSKVGIKKVHNNINNKIQIIKTLAENTAKENAYQLNVFTFIGHGIINEKD